MKNHIRYLELNSFEYSVLFNSIDDSISLYQDFVDRHPNNNLANGFLDVLFKLQLKMIDLINDSSDKTSLRKEREKTIN